MGSFSEALLRPSLHREVTWFVSEVSLAEFYHKTAGKKGVQTAEVRYLQLPRSSLRVVAPDESIMRQAASWKAKRSGLSLADCFALATNDAKKKASY